MAAQSVLRTWGEQLRSGRRLEFTGRTWTVVVALLIAFVLVIEAIARFNHIRGPVGLLATDLVGRPGIGELKMAGMLLALVCMPARLRVPVLASTVGLELLWNAQRWTVGNPGTVGNGILFVLLGTAVLAGWRLHGVERAATLKAVGLGLLLIVMGRVGDVWLVLSSRANTSVLDEYVELADRALGSPSWAVGSVVAQHPWLTEILMKVYVYLPVAAAVIAFFQLRNSARDGFPRHHIVRTFLLIGMVGPVVYFLFPVVGPVFAFGDELPGAGWQAVWPLHLPVIGDPSALPFDSIVPRNCMPSLHTAWAMCILLHGWRGSPASKVFGVVWLVLTTGATLGFGFHYAVDVLAGVVFTLTVEAALTRPELGWTRHRVAVIAFGTVAFTALLASTRYLAVELAGSGFVGGLSLIVLVLVVVAAFLTIELYPETVEVPVDVTAPPLRGPADAVAARALAGSARAWAGAAALTRAAKKDASTRL